METVILAEKPKQAKAIKDATGIKTFPATGHLLTLMPKKKWDPPYFDLEWRPKNKKKEDQLKTLVNKLKAADKIVVGTDFDPEGQLIAYNILEQAGIDVADVQRMKFSSLEPEELLSSYENPIEFDLLLARSAETRTFLDWFFGMNISKALTLRLKRDMKIERAYYLTPVGRVQTPVLNFLSVRENEILEFIGKEEWVVRAYGTIPEKNMVFHLHTFTASTKKIAESIAGCDQATIKKYKEETIDHKYYPPNKDHVVGECLKKGLKPDIVDRVMQELYQDAYISYPRTTSKNYTAHGINTRKYIQALDLNDISFKFDPKELRNEPNEKAPEGPHPAIYPLKHYPDKDIGRLVWDVIVNSFLKCHLPPEERIERAMDVEIIGYGRVDSYDVPEGLTQGNDLQVYYDIKKERTAPPRRHDLQKTYAFMVENKIGTVDTRTQTITKLLYTYLYQTDDGLFTSSKGVKVTKMLKDLCPDMIGVDLTRKFEKYVENIKKDGKTEEILKEAKETVTEIVKNILKE